MRIAFTLCCASRERLEVRLPASMAIIPSIRSEVSFASLDSQL